MSEEPVAGSWSEKLANALNGNYESLFELKHHLRTSQWEVLHLDEYEFDELLLGSHIHTIDSDGCYGGYEMFTDVPLFFVLSGNVEIRCINMEGQMETISHVDERGALTLNRKGLQTKFGKENLNLLTKFELYAHEKTLLIETKLSFGKIFPKQCDLTEKQLCVLKRFILVPLKEAKKTIIKQNTFIHDKVYLLSGKACYYLDEPDFQVILACYTEGYLNPKQFLENNKIKLFIFQDSEVLHFEEQFIKDEYIKALEYKRENHLRQLIKEYKKMNKQQYMKVQQKLIVKYRLNRKVIEQKIYKIKSVQKQQILNKSEKKPKSKTDLTSTSSSIRCAIRIRKAKKIS